MRKKSFWFILLVIIAGGLVGSALGEFVGYILPDGVVKQALTKSVIASIGPGTFDIVILSITLGFSININFLGVLGIIIAAYMLRWIE
jgi:hypothetical protein